VFIDYNQDGDFTDSGETVYTKATSTGTTATGSITIPATATLGTTRMRVSMKYNGIPTACESFSYGQVEDYSVNITASGTVVVQELIGDTDKVISEVTVYPNPVDGELNVSSSEKSATSFKITNTLGQLVSSGQLSESPIDVSKLTRGVYII
jgi:hypothetical protein